MSGYSRVYENEPELWDEDISYMAKLAYVDGSQRVIASGWHRRQIEFENPKVKFSERSTGESIVDIGGEKQADKPSWDQVEAFEIELALNEIHLQEAVGVLANLIDQTLAEKLVSSVGNMVQRVSANRNDTTILDEEGNELYCVDLLAQNLPARSGNQNEPLRFLHRWCRIFELPNGTITIYESLKEEQKRNLRWPHYCIWLNRDSDYYLKETEIGEILTAVEIPIKYEQYNLDNWRIEFDFWANQPFQIITNEDSDVASHGLGIAQKELGVLSQFITVAFLSARNLERRVKRNKIFLEHPEVLEMAQERVGEITTAINEGREKLYRGSELLANTAQSVQAVANQKNVEAMQKTNTFLTIVSAIFFAPTLIISFYSMSIIGLDEREAVPTSVAVLILCIVSVVLTLLFAGVVKLATRTARRKKIKRKTVR